MPLTPVALQLKDYTFFRIKFGPNEAVPFDMELQPKTLEASDLDCVAKILNEPTEDEDLVLSLEVWITEEALSENSPCDFAVEMMGRFSLPETLLGRYNTIEDIKNGVIRNSVTILYGCIRDLVHTLSVKMPFGTLILPTCSFNYLSIADEDQEPPQKIPDPQPKAKRSRKSNI